MRTPLGPPKPFLASDIPQRANCVIFDVQMGGMSGTLLLTQLRIAGARTPFIFVSGNLADHDRLMSTRYAAPLLEKLIEPDELVALVRAMLR
ncbi:response regulator [Paraburkholderia youngii]|uniref:response regulator n=1 Tax=Paraburkholderia youngii TaxID=2782701 RepID=UPI003D21BB88